MDVAALFAALGLVMAEEVEAPASGRQQREVLAGGGVDLVVQVDRGRPVPLVVP